MVKRKLAGYSHVNCLAELNKAKTGTVENCRHKNSKGQEHKKYSIPKITQLL